MKRIILFTTIILGSFFVSCSSDDYSESQLSDFEESLMENIYGSWRMDSVSYDLGKSYQHINPDLYMNFANFQKMGGVNRVEMTIPLSSQQQDVISDIFYLIGPEKIKLEELSWELTFYDLKSRESATMKIDQKNGVRTYIKMHQK